MKSNLRIIIVTAMAALLVGVIAGVVYFNLNHKEEKKLEMPLIPALEIVLPTEPPVNEHNRTEPGGNITLLITKIDGEDALLMWEGSMEQEKLKETTFQELRSERKLQSGRDGQMVIIKVADDGSYQSMIAVLDEMAISGISNYKIEQLTTQEIEIIKNYKDSKRK